MWRMLKIDNKKVWGITIFSTSLKINELNYQLSWQHAIEKWFRPSGSYYPVYTYDPVYKKDMDLTIFSLPDDIIERALQRCRQSQNLYMIGSKILGDSGDYDSEWRDALEGDGDDRFNE